MRLVIAAGLVDEPGPEDDAKGTARAANTQKPCRDEVLVEKSFGFSRTRRPNSLEHENPVILDGGNLEHREAAPERGPQEHLVPQNALQLLSHSGFNLAARRGRNLKRPVLRCGRHLNSQPPCREEELNRPQRGKHNRRYHEHVSVGQPVRGAEASDDGAQGIPESSGNRAQAKPHRPSVRGSHGHGPHSAPHALQGLRCAHDEFCQIHQSLAADPAEHERASCIDEQADCQQQLRVAIFESNAPRHGRGHHSKLVHGTKNADLELGPRLFKHFVLERVQSRGNSAAIIRHEHLDRLARDEEHDHPRRTRRYRRRRVQRFRTRDTAA
mmetsp:Transcript_22056/g.61782  ORF Transcript_22056/g.61782 Transcript_22056/m.61782 type:complete len:327 (-) Transcript_22056:279-1259(-)